MVFQFFTLDYGYLTLVLGYKAGNNEDTDDNNDGLPTKRYDKSVPYNLETDKGGWPIIPDEDDLPLITLRDMIRSIVTMTYRKS